MSFELLADLGEVTVPDNYVHGTRLDTFRKKHGKKFCYYNGAITDKSFPNPSRVLEPGDKFWVRAFKQDVSGVTTSEERMAFLDTQQAVYTGAQGVSLVFRQKRHQLPRGFLYASFDERERLWKDTDGSHGVPYVIVLSGGGFDFDLYPFEHDRDDAYCLLCFNDLQAGVEC